MNVYIRIGCVGVNGAFNAIFILLSGYLQILASARQ